MKERPWCARFGCQTRVKDTRSKFCSRRCIGLDTNARMTDDQRHERAKLGGWRHRVWPVTHSATSRFL